MTLFRNDSPGALTLDQAVELEIKRRDERRRQARELAAQGRGADTEIAHVAPGEIVIPWILQTPELLAALTRAAAAQNRTLESLRIGSRRNSINPATGMAEFRDVSGEPRVAKGSGDESGQWTSGGSAGAAGARQVLRNRNRMSEQGREILKKREGHSDEPYPDSGGNTTSGYGHKGVLTGSAEETFSGEAAIADDDVNQTVRVPLTQYQHDALSSIAFNMGRGRFIRSGLPALLNAGRFAEAADLIPHLTGYTDHDRAKHPYIKGLENRRVQERLQFLGKLGP